MASADSGNLHWQHSQVEAPERVRLLRQEPRTVWLTGLSGAGKSTLAFALERHLVAAGRLAFVLDGDNIRHGLNRDLGFSHDDRTENIRRVAEVAKLMNDAGLIVITAFISPYRDDRAMARAIIGADRFVETYVATNLQVCEARDPKGMYKKARAGTIADFTGIGAPYQAPQAGLRIDTDGVAVDTCVTQILEAIG